MSINLIVFEVLHDKNHSVSIYQHDTIFFRTTRKR
jgi:hypothetical protein